ncbi:MAG: radical SAM protein [Parcubacteria group bacterium]
MREDRRKEMKDEKGKIKALLVYPEYPDTFWSFSYTLKQFTTEKAAFPPLGLMTVGAMLPQDWNLKLIDMNVKELLDVHIEWADIVFVSAMLAQAESAQNVIWRCKEFGKKVVVGGPAFTACHEQFFGFDHVISGEAEDTLPLFLKDLEKGSAKKIYASLKKPDITETPIPLWPLINFADYATMPLQFSRGCPFNCEFCDIIVMYGRIQRAKTPGQTIREFQSLFEAGWRGSVFVVDDNLIGNIKKVKEMLRWLVEWQKQRRYPFKLITEASVNLADDADLLGLMAKANFHEVFVGIETVSESSLKECGKKQNLGRSLTKAVRTIHQHGLQVMGGFIFGFDHDDPGKVFGEMTEFIQKTGVVVAMAGLLNALPGTRLWRRLEKEGRVTEGISRGENTDGDTNIEPLMGKEKLIGGYKDLISVIYSPRMYYARIDAMLRDLRPVAHGRLSMREIKIFLKSLWKIGVLARDRRFFFWKTLLSSGRKFSVVIKLAVFGEHLLKFAEKFRD